MDSFSVSTLTGRVLFVSVSLSHDSLFFGPRQGAAFYVFSGQAAYCRARLTAEGLDRGVVESTSSAVRCCGKSIGAVTNLTMPAFTPDGRLISQPLQESCDRHAIWIFETATGRSHLAVRFPGPFLIDLRAGWTDGGTALVVNRRQVISHVVLFDRFWKPR